MARTALALVLAFGCSSKSPPSEPPPSATAKASAPAPKQPAPTGKWSMNNNLSLSGPKLGYGVEVSIFVVGGKLSINPIKMPLGTVFEIGGQRFETKQKYGNRFELPLEAAIADLPWSQLKPVGKYLQPEKVDLKLSLSVTLPDHETLVTPLAPMLVTTKLEEVFIPMATSDKTWPGETAPTGPAPAAAAWAVSGFEAIGTADKVRDVRYIVTGTRSQNDRTRRCSGYIGARDFTATSYDEELSLVDRTTKKTIATKKFMGQPGCPNTVITGPGTPPASNEGPSMKAMRAWVAAQLPK